MTLLAAISLLIWLYLCLFHGRFWHSDQMINSNQVNIKEFPRIVGVIPARDEAESIGRTVRALLDQDYAGPFSIIVVDDNSTDGTADEARAVLKDDEDQRLRVIAGAPLAEGWVGKMWAVNQGIAAAGDAEYILLSDADIEHTPDSLTRLVTKAETENLGLVSEMVKLHCGFVWERFLIPAFIYFFQKLYPFPRVNDPKSGMAAAAGGCMLVHAATLKDAGGIAEIRSCIIDDCALARLIKPHRPVWLGLSTETHSLRSYESLIPIWRMVARTAYVQLNHNPLLLVGTLAAEDGQRVVLNTVGQQLTVLQSDIQSRTVSKLSMMPEGLLNVDGDEVAYIDGAPFAEETSPEQLMQDITKVAEAL